LLTGLAAAACSQQGSSPSETPSAEPLHLAVELGAPSGTAGLARAFGRLLGVEVASVDPADWPHLTISLQAPPATAEDGTSSDEGSSTAVAYRYWVPVAPFWSRLEGLAWSDLRAALTTGSTAPGGASTLYLPSDLREELERAVGEPIAAPDRGSAVHWLPQSEIAAALASDEGGLGLLPMEAVDYRVRSLALDGIDMVRGIGPSEDYPLANRLWLITNEEAVAESPPSMRTDVERLVDLLRGHFQAQAAPRPIRLLATGDIIPARCVYAEQLAYQDFRHAFLATADVLRAADVTVGSLDASLSDAGQPIGCTETFSLLAPARSIEGLTFAGFDVLSVASNHAKDCGASACGDQAFLDTLANLEAAGIAAVGGGRNLAEARSARVLTVNGVRFAFLGYDDIGSSDYGATEDSPGTAPLAFGSLGEDVARARQQADVVIVLNHWGTEYTPVPTERQRGLAREAVGAGATLVIGNHPHAVQAVEFPEGGFVSYALGNFVFDQDWSLETQQGVVLEAVFHGPRLVSVRFLPVHIYDQHQPRWAEPAEGESILGRMEGASAGLPPFP
jgi:poly-gamma-glutamate capsule biosynthesis protein CapA/YwtB (metallophosphatase superfamily)